jgi:hypothetical protein
MIQVGFIFLTLLTTDDGRTDVKLVVVKVGILSNLAAGRSGHRIFKGSSEKIRVSILHYSEGKIKNTIGYSCL